MDKLRLFRTVLVSVFAFTISVAAAGKDKEVIRNVNKSFKVKDNVELVLDVNFSTVKIETWDQAQVDVDIAIRSEASSDERAAEILDRIDVSVQGSETQVKVITELDNTNCRKEEQFDIEVTIRMPKNGSIVGNCNFGDLNVGDLNGPCKAHVQYASLNATVLRSNLNDVRVSFGDLNADAYGGGEVFAEYSSLEINRLTGDCEVTSKFGDVDIDQLDAACKNLEIDIEYGNAEIKLPPGVSYEINAKSEFGDISFPVNVKKTSVEKGYTSEEYIGTIGSNPQAKIHVRTQFGDVEFE